MHTADTQCSPPRYRCHQDNRGDAAAASLSKAVDPRELEVLQLLLPLVMSMSGVLCCPRRPSPRRLTPCPAARTALKRSVRETLRHCEPSLAWVSAVAWYKATATHMARGQCRQV